MKIIAKKVALSNGIFFSADRHDIWFSAEEIVDFLDEVPRNNRCWVTGVPPHLPDR
jgi:hypothetical protein